MSNLFDVTEQTKQIAEFVKALPPRLLTHDPKSRPVHVPQAVAYYVKPTDEVRAIPCPPWLEEMAAAIRRNDVEVAAALVPLTKPVFSRLAAHVMGDNPPGEFHESTDLLAHIRSVNPKLRISPVSGVKLDIDKDEMDGHALGMFFLPILRLAQTLDRTARDVADKAAKAGGKGRYKMYYSGIEYFVTREAFLVTAYPWTHIVGWGE